MWFSFVYSWNQNVNHPELIGAKMLCQSQPRNNCKTSLSKFSSFFNNNNNLEIQKTLSLMIQWSTNLGAFYLFQSCCNKVWKIEDKKLAEFNYKLISNIICTRSLIAKWNPNINTLSCLCRHCGQRQTIKY